MLGVNKLKCVKTNSTNITIDRPNISEQVLCLKGFGELPGALFKVVWGATFTDVYSFCYVLLFFWYYQVLCLKWFGGLRLQMFIAFAMFCYFFVCFAMFLLCFAMFCYALLCFCYVFAMLCYVLLCLGDGS